MKINLQQKLSVHLLDLLGQIGELARQQGDTLYLVGGFVRDLFLMTTAEAKTSPRFDLDLVVEGEAIALAERLQQQYGGQVVSHRRFGTAKWLLAQPIPFNSAETVFFTSLDFAMARTEFYRYPSALPEVERSSIRLDLHRRDFTINTLALDLSPDRFGELLDFYGGRKDLESRLIRVLHPLSFVEDPTRMVRAARFLARFNFTLEEQTAEQLHDALDLLQRVSGERLLHELELIFRERLPLLALQQLDHLRILKAIDLALQLDEWLVERLDKLKDVPLDSVYYLGLMLFRLNRTEQTTIMKRLNLPVRQQTIINQVCTLRPRLAEIEVAEKGSQLYHLLRGSSDEARQIVGLAVDELQVRHQLVRFQTELQHVTPLIDGTYLKTEFQLSPGPIFRTILDTLRNARLDGLVTTLADERALVVEILATN